MVHSSSTVRCIAALLAGAFLFCGCDTGVEVSPDPGILRVILESNPADTTMVIAGETVGVGSSAFFGVRIFQGRAFRDSSFIVLLKTTDSYREQDFVYNVLARDEDGFEEYTLFESLVPPGDYDSLRFGANAEQLLIGAFNIPVRLPEEAEPSLTFAVPFEMEAGMVTEVRLMIDPLESVERYRDAFLFRRKLQVVEVGEPAS